MMFDQWVVQGAIQINTGANPSAEGGEEDEGADDQAVKVVDIVDTFRLQVGITFPQTTELPPSWSISLLVVTQILSRL